MGAWHPQMIADGDTPDAEALHHLRRREQGGPPVYRDRDGNWRGMEAITEEE